MQTKKQSMLESITNIIVGYGVATMSNVVILPFLDIQIEMVDNFIIGFYMTAISLVRSYTIRRIFNKKHSKQEQKNA